MEVEEDDDDNPMDEEWQEEPAKKYGNGKPKKVVKEQTFFKEDI